MAEFSQLIITKKGQALVAKMLSGIQGVKFTRIAASDAVYKLVDLEKMETLGNVRQSADVAKVTRTSDVTVTVETAFTNTDLIAGYFMRALGLYAVDPNDGEILYAVAIETSGNCYMPLYAGVTVSGAYIQLVTSVGNATNVSLEVSNSANATIGDINELRKKIDALVPRVDAVEKQMTGIDEQVAKNTGQLGFSKYLGFHLVGVNISKNLSNLDMPGYSDGYWDVVTITSDEMIRQFNAAMQKDYNTGNYAFDQYLYSLYTTSSMIYPKILSGVSRDIFGTIEFKIEGRVQTSLNGIILRKIRVPLIVESCDESSDGKSSNMRHTVSVDFCNVTLGLNLFNGIKILVQNHLCEKKDGIIKPLTEKINFDWHAKFDIYYLGMNLGRKWPSGSF